jgi:hypothetical protein
MQLRLDVTGIGEDPVEMAQRSGGETFAPTVRMNRYAADVSSSGDCLPLDDRRFALNWGP